MASTLPNVTLTVQSSGLSLDPPASATQSAIVGPCAGGTANVVYGPYTTRQALYAALVGGPAVECAADRIAKGGAPVLVVPTTQTTAGAAGSVTQTGTGPTVSLAATSAVTATGTTPPTVTLTGTPTAAINLVIDITTGGAIGTAIFVYSTNGGLTFSAATVTASTFVIPGTGVTIGFAAGTYSTTNVYSASTCIPYDAYELGITIASGGVLGTATFQFALDNLNPGGATQSALFTVPSSGVFAIQGTGLAITFASGTYVAGTTYTAACTAPSYTTAGMLSAIQALAAQTQDWRFVHVVGQAASTSASVTQFSSLDGQMTTDFNASQYHFAVMETATDTDANILSGYASTTSASLRAGVAAGFSRIAGSAPSGPTLGMTLSRSTAWSACTRAAAIAAGIDVAEYDLGPIAGVTSLSRDENVTPALDTAGFITMRSFTGQAGYFITNGRLLVNPSSSFTLFQYRRTMDLACKISYADFLQYLNKPVLVTAAGTILEISARSMESAVNQDLSNQLVLTQPQNVNATQVVVNRSNNIVTTAQLLATVSIQPLGYAKFIGVTLGFVASLTTPA